MCMHSKHPRICHNQNKNRLKNDRERGWRLCVSLLIYMIYKLWILSEPNSIKVVDLRIEDPAELEKIEFASQKLVQFSEMAIKTACNNEHLQQAKCNRQIMRRKKCPSLLGAVIKCELTNQIVLFKNVRHQIFKRKSLLR